MRLRRIFFATLLVAITCSNAHAGMADLINGVKVGSQLPPVELHYLGTAPTVVDHLVLIDFWATWCEPCRTSIPSLNALQARFATKGLVVIGVSPETAEVVLPFLQTVPLHYAIAIDDSSGLHKSLHIRALPYAMFVSRSGRIVWRGQTAEIDDALVNALLRQ